MPPASLATAVKDSRAVRRDPGAEAPRQAPRQAPRGSGGSRAPAPAGAAPLRSPAPHARQERVGQAPGSAAAAGAGRPRLLVVGAPRHTRRWTAVLVAVGAVGVFVVVGLNAVAAESAFTARSLEADVNELALRYEELTAEVAALGTPDRLAEIATTQLGMVPAEEPSFLLSGRDVRSVATPVGVRLRSDGPADPLKPVLGTGR
jgi:cell division protein FtsB